MNGQKFELYHKMAEKCFSLMVFAKFDIKY
jgi:hypothetical protein